MFDELYRHVQTPAFQTMLFDKLVGIGVNAAILSALVPLILWLIRRRRAAMLRFRLRFYLFQVFHKLVALNLRLAGIADPMPRLMNALRARTIPELESHTAFGNIENKFWLLRQVIESGELARELPKRTEAELGSCERLCRSCLEEIDQLANFVVSSPKLFETMLTVRMLAFVTRDQLEGWQDEIRTGHDGGYHQYQVKKISSATLEALEHLFKAERKHVDRPVAAHWRKRMMRLFVEYTRYRSVAAYSRIVQALRGEAGPRAKAKEGVTAPDDKPSARA